MLHPKYQITTVVGLRRQPNENLDVSMSIEFSRPSEVTFEANQLHMALYDLYSQLTKIIEGECLPSNILKKGSILLLMAVGFANDPL